MCAVLQYGYICISCCWMLHCMLLFCNMCTFEKALLCSRYVSGSALCAALQYWSCWSLHILCSWYVFGLAFCFTTVSLSHVWRGPSPNNYSLFYNIYAWCFLVTRDLKRVLLSLLLFLHLKQCCIWPLLMYYMQHLVSNIIGELPAFNTHFQRDCNYLCTSFRKLGSISSSNVHVSWKCYIFCSSVVSFGYTQWVDILLALCKVGHLSNTVSLEAFSAFISILATIAAFW